MAEHLRQSPPWDRLEPRLRAMTRMLVRRHRRLIARVAKALFARTTLTAEELDKLVTQRRRREAERRRPVPVGDGGAAGSPVDIEPLGSTGLRALLTP